MVRSELEHTEQKRIRLICDNCGEKKQLLKLFVYKKKQAIHYVCDACGLETWFTLMAVKNQ